MDSKLKSVLDNFIFDNSKTLKEVYNEKQILLLFANNQFYYDGNYDVEELIDEFIFENEFTLSKPIENSDSSSCESNISFVISDFDFQEKDDFLNQIFTKLDKLEKILPEENIDEDININIYFDVNIKSNNCIKNIFEKLDNYKIGKFLNYNVTFEIKTAVDILGSYSNNGKHEVNVKEFSFKIDDSNNVLCSPEHENIESVLVNIKATSINEIYKAKGINNGPLFYSNLRYYVKNKKIDEDIKKSIEETKNEFWFKNNGIVIICKNFEILKNNEVKVLDFSFINGGQTTFMIGSFDSSSDKLDFFVLAKIISIEKLKNSDKFIESISIATNRQKPIKDVDLNVNLPEIKKIKSLMSSYQPQLNLIVKRGEVIPKDISSKPEIKKLRNFTLESLGTLISAFCLQMPGTAKNQKKVVWNDLKSLIFEYARPNYIYIANYLKYEIETLEKTKRKDEFLTYYKTGKFFIIAIIFFLWNYKFYSTEIDKIFFDCENSKKFSSDNIKKFLEISDSKFNNMKIKNDHSDFEENIKNLIELIVSKLEENFTNSNYKKENASATFANYSKSDDNYWNFVKKIKKDIQIKEKDKRELFNALNNIFSY